MINLTKLCCVLGVFCKITEVMEKYFIGLMLSLLTEEANANTKGFVIIRAAYLRTMTTIPEVASNEPITNRLQVGPATVSSCLYSYTTD